MVTLDARDLGHRVPGRVTRRYTSDDLRWANGLLARTTGRLRIRRGVLVDTAVLPGLVTLDGDYPTGLVTVLRHHDELELAVLAATPGDDLTLSALIDAAVSRAGENCRRVWAVCSNAEFALQRILQVEGFRLCAARAGAIEAAVARMPQGQLVSEIDGVPVRDELEFDLLLR